MTHLESFLILLLNSNTVLPRTVVARLQSLKETPLMFDQLSPFLDREVLNVAVPRTFSRSIRVFHVHGNLVICIKQFGGKPSSMIMDRKNLVTLAASKRAR
jgi:hypothetical protein